MKKLSALFAVFLLTDSVLLDARAIFNTLTEVQQYAESLPENVDAENQDWSNPEFSSYHRSLVPNPVQRFFSWLGFWRGTWNAQGFKALLISVTKQRELSGFIGDFIQKYAVVQGDKIFVWTDLFGAFHSLVRDLLELRRDGVIDDSFKLVKDSYLLVFNGNVINYSPYVLEILTLVMRLLEVNPYQVIYTRGDHEDKQTWHSYGLARELKIRGVDLSPEMIPLNRAVTRFFNTLPLGLFIPEVTEKTVLSVLIANNEYSQTGFDTKRFAGFLARSSDDRLSTFKLSNKETSEKSVQVRVFISGEDRSITYHQTSGLTMLGMQQEALRWLVFSSPTGRNRRLYDFFYDAFAEITVRAKLENWTITLHNQDLRKLLGFAEAATYNLLTGQPIIKAEREIKKVIPGVQEKKVDALEKRAEVVPISPEKEADQKKDAELTTEATFGSTIDLTKGASSIGKLIKDGLEIAFARAIIQKEGQFLPRLLVYDDEYTPTKTRALITDFINKSVDIFLNPVGSPTTESYLDLVRTGKVLVLFPYTGAPIFRKPDLKYMAHMRVGYVDEGKVLATYALDQLKSRKIVVFYQNDAFGQGTLQGALEVFEQRGFKDVVKVPYERNDVQFEQQAKAIEQAEADTIFFFAVTPAAQSLIKQLGVPFFRGKHLIGMSVYSESFERFLEANGLRFVMLRVVPDPRTSELEIVRQYRAAAKETNHVPNITSLEAFINAQVLFDILKRLAPPLTKEKIIREIENTKNYNFGGMDLDFNPDTRELVRTLWLDTGEGPWIKKDVRAKDEKKPEKLQQEVTKPLVTKMDEVTSDGLQKFVIGSTMDLSKSASPIGKKVKEGLLLRFDKERIERTLGTVVPEIVTQDDEYTPKKTRQEVERLVQDMGIRVVIGSQGSPSLESYLDWVKEGKLLVLFPFTGSPLFRKPDLKYLVHFRGSYIREGEELIKYALDELKAKKVVIFYQNDAFGKGPLEGARRALKKAGVSDFVEVPHERNDVDFKKHAEIITNAHPDTILFSTNATPIRGLIRQMGVDFFAGKILLGVSVYEEAFEQFLKDKGLKFILTRMVPDPTGSQLEIAREYRAAADAQNLAYDRVAFEQYINASILIDVLKRLKDGITKEKIIEAMEGIKKYEFKGLYLDFDPETRELSPVLWLDTGRGEWLVKSARNGLAGKNRVEKKTEDKEPIVAEKKVVSVVEKKPLVLGFIMDLSRGVKAQGKAVLAGIELRLKEAREQGDQSIAQVMIADDEYTPSKTRKEVEAFLQKGIDILLAPGGSPTLEAYIDLVKDGKVLVLFPITGAPMFRKPDLKYVIHLRPSYKTEGELLTTYAIDTLKTIKAVMFYQDDAFGLGVLEGARDVLKQRNITNWLEVPYTRNDVDFKKQVAQILKYDPGTILFFSVTSAASELMNQMGIQNVSDKKMLANSDFGEEKFLSFMRSKGIHISYLNVVPNPQKSELSIVKQFREAAKKYDVPLDTFTLEAYIATDLMIDVIHQIEGEVTKEKIVNVLSKMKNYNFKGLHFDFNPDTRTLSSTFWLDTGDPDWQEITVKPTGKEAA